jgi:hypothetical protein
MTKSRNIQSNPNGVGKSQGRTSSRPIFRRDFDDPRLVTASVRIGGRVRLHRPGDYLEFTGRAKTLATHLDATAWMGRDGHRWAPTPVLLLDGNELVAYTIGDPTADGTGYQSVIAHRIPGRVRLSQDHVCTRLQWATASKWIRRCITTTVERGESINFRPLFDAPAIHFGVHVIGDRVLVTNSTEFAPDAWSILEEYPRTPEGAAAAGFEIDTLLVSTWALSPLDVTVEFPDNTWRTA